MKERFWSKDWFAALCFALVFFIVAYSVLGDSFQSLERFGYDKGVRARAATPSDRIAIVAIDDESIQNLGRWPWPRTLQAQLIDKLREGGAKVIANTALYLESEQGAGAQVLGKLLDDLKASPLVQQIPAEIQTFGVMLDDTAHQSRAVAPIAEAYRDSALAKQYQPLITELLQKLEAAAQGGGSPDGVLAASIKAHGHVLLPMVFKLGRPQGRPDQQLPDYVQKNALTQIEDHVDARAAGAVPQPALEVLAPVPAIGGSAAAIGHLNILPDIDGAVRFEPLVISYFDQIYPSMSLVIAEQALNLTPADVHVKLGEGVSLADLDIQTSPSLRMYTQFYPDRNGAPAFPSDSAFDVLSGKIPLTKYKDKIVLIGTTAVGTGDTFATPASPVTAPVQMLAHAVSSILQEDFFIRPSWGPYVEIAALLLIVLYLALLLPRLPATVAALVTGTLIAVLLGTQIGLMAVSAMWLKLMIPTVFLLSGHLFMTVKQFRLTERAHATSEAEGAESNKMLGLAFQGQGQLDMAFDKFRRVQPVDDRVLDLIYNLALDFERKRQFHKAESAYQYIAGFNKEFRDIPQKLSRAKKVGSPGTELEFAL